eukprot:sb/3478830/
MFGYRFAFQCDREQLNWITTRDTVSCFLKLVRSCDPRRIMKRFGIANQAKGQRNLVSRPLMGATDLMTNQHRHPSLAAVIRDSLPLILIRNTEHSTIR